MNLVDLLKQFLGEQGLENLEAEEPCVWSFSVKTQLRTHDLDLPPSGRCFIRNKAQNDVNVRRHQSFKVHSPDRHQEGGSAQSRASGGCWSLSESPERRGLGAGAHVSSLAHRRTWKSQERMNPRWVKPHWGAEVCWRGPERPGHWLSLPLKDKYPIRTW